MKVKHSFCEWKHQWGEVHLQNVQCVRGTWLQHRLLTHQCYFNGNKRRRKQSHVISTCTAPLQCKDARHRKVWPIKWQQCTLKSFRFQNFHNIQLCLWSWQPKCCCVSPAAEKHREVTHLCCHFIVDENICGRCSCRTTSKLQAFTLNQQQD